MNLERDVALPVVEDAVRDTHTGTISPRVIYDHGVEAWDAVLTGEWTTRDGSTPTELDREVLATVWDDVAGDVGEMVGQE
ncbi:hypothetical protein [Halospeciosus flavus]|uniref:Uncharacterized protein n=1 Tax=Halospeciosus flavus TaxID=3032283 RepID=A0ABD5Z647_9EURY|nr:hypothetical protein [Halospeciosus flavus]